MIRVDVRNINKAYKLYDKPHHRLLEAVLRKPRHTVFKALENISFSIGIGRSLGVIGNNGAGKSTLLKLLAGTLHPTTGDIVVNGRVAALLELGAGFHPDFTGRQNIYLKASLLGISQDEIRRREQEIIEFAELENFIDRPVRSYSSGMYVRLAFSIATTVDPDVLIIDEALAVGDMAFQKKCTLRMNRFKHDGKSLVFCSHSMYHVQELCDTVVWLENGCIRHMGPASEVIGLYEDSVNQKKKSLPNGPKNTATGAGTGKQCTGPVPARENQAGNPAAAGTQGDARIVSFELKSLDGKVMQTLDIRDPMVLEMTVEIIRDGMRPHFGFGIFRNTEEILSARMSNHEGLEFGPYGSGEKVTVRFRVDHFPLRAGTVLLVASFSDELGLLWNEKAYLGPFTIVAEKGVGTLSFNGRWSVREPMATQKG